MSKADERCKNCRYFKPLKYEQQKGFGECNCRKFKYESSYNWEKKRTRKR